jgi:hypothetical protein
MVDAVTVRYGGRGIVRYGGRGIVRCGGRGNRIATLSSSDRY